MRQRTGNASQSPAGEGWTSVDSDELYILDKLKMNLKREVSTIPEGSIGISLINHRC